MKKVSIIIPVYNVEGYLIKCIQSIVKQTYSNIEIILINDGSTDESGSICKKMEEIYYNIKVINQNNKGVSAARNAGLKESVGDYIMFVDPDDWCEPNMVERMVDSIKDADFAYCAFFIDTDNTSRILYNPIEAGKYTVCQIYDSLELEILQSQI